MKKGFEMQFTWIFVLIAGAIIFAFLISITTKQKEQAQLKEDVKVKEHLASIIAISSSSTNAVNSFDYAPTSITFTCDEPDSSNFRVGTKGATQSLATSAVFSQKELNGGQLFTWTLDWMLPYKAATFVYVTNKRTRYIFYTPTDQGKQYANKLLNDFPTDLKVERADTGDKLKELIVEKGYDANVIVQIEMGTPSPGEYVEETALDTGSAGSTEFPNINDKIKSRTHQVYLVRIIPNSEGANPNTNFGEVHFAKRVHYTGENGKSYFYGKEMIFGAIFAPQKNLYQCAIRKAFQRAELVSQINFQRVSELDASATTDGTLANPTLKDVRPNCQYLYSYIKGTFDNKSYPYCGNVKIFEYISLELAKATGGNPLNDNKENTKGTGCDGVSTDASCTYNHGCSDKTFQRLDDNNNRLVREARDISLEGGCPYVY